MTTIDFAKAFGLAIAVMAANLLLSFIAVFAYAQLVEPGHPQDFYSAAAPRIAAWSAPLGGALLMFGVAYLFGRRPGRNAYAFAASVVALYVVIDLGLGLATAPAAQIFSAQMALSLGIAVLGTLAGAALARRHRASASNG